MLQPFRNCTTTASKASLTQWFFVFDEQPTRPEETGITERSLKSVGLKKGEHASSLGVEE
jgi:hypothetical protein